MTKDTTQTNDLIVDTVKEISALGQEEAVRLVPDLIAHVDFSYFKLGGVLSLIKEHGWWSDTDPSFEVFIKENYGLRDRKARYLIKIYNGLVASEVPWSKVSHLGWTKLKDLADILTLDNVDEWVERAEGMSTLNLQQAVKAAKGGEGASADGTTEPDTSGVSTLTFKVHPDQKETINEAIVQAMEDADTEFKGVALEAICMGFLSGSSTPTPVVVTKPAKPQTLTEVLYQHSAEDVLEAFEVVWPEINLTAELAE